MQRLAQISYFPRSPSVKPTILFSKKQRDPVCSSAGQERIIGAGRKRTQDHGPFLLSFAADLTSRAAPSCSGSSDERSSSTPRNRSSGGLPSTHLSLYKKPLPRGEQKLQDEYVLDSRIHSRLDPPWNLRNLQKHSRGGLVLLKDHKVLKWQDRGGLQVFVKGMLFSCYC